MLFIFSARNLNNKEISEEEKNKKKYFGRAVLIYEGHDMDLVN